MDDLENFVRAGQFFKGGETAKARPQTHGRVPPHSLEAERSFLAGLFLDNSAIHRITDVILEPEDFYSDAHQRIFRVVRELMNRGEPADLVTVTSALQAQGALEKVGGRDYLSLVMEAEFSASNVPHYAKIIKDNSILRQLHSVTSEIAAEALGSIDDQAAFLDSAEKRVFAVTEMKNSHAFGSLKDVLLGNFQEMQDLANNKGTTVSVTTGFRDLDAHTSGWRPGQLIIVAARPGMGKTSFMLNLARNAALESKKPVAIFSMEMSKSELGMRMIATEAKVDSERLKTGRLQEQDWKNLTRAGARLAEAPVFIDDTGGLNLLEVKARCRRLQSVSGLGMIIIDYLQLMSGMARKGMSSNREQEIAEISRGLKALAKELSVPVIAASQLNRGVETRQDKRPMLSDLRESGAIEQDADIVVFIHREAHYSNNPDHEDKAVAEIIIGKHRSGQTGIVKLAWLGQYTSFEDLSPRDVPADGF